MKRKICCMLVLLALAMGCKKDQNGPDLNKGLVSYFNFDDNLIDTEGYANNGIGNAVFTSGKIGSALSFNGVNQQMLLSPKVPQSSSKISLAFWIKVNSGGTFIMSNLDKNIITPDDFLLDSSNSTFAFGLQKSGVYYGAAADFSQLNTWYHVVNTYDGAEAKIYLDGVLGSTKAIITSIGGFNKNIILGRNGQQSYWAGSIDELRIYNRALTEAEVTALYNLK